MADYSTPLAPGFPAPGEAIGDLQDIGRLFYDRNWSVGTSSNYSVVLSRDPFRLLISASGKDKRSLTRDDFVIVDESGTVLHAKEGNRPSAETWLHLVIATHKHVGAVLHTHSIWGTVLSDLYEDDGGWAIEGYEMLKGLAGVSTHEHRQWVKIYPNTQQVRELAMTVRDKLRDPIAPLHHGFYISRHGLYTWGKDLAEARRHVEVFEFLFEVQGRRLSVNKP